MSDVLYLSTFVISVFLYLLCLFIVYILIHTYICYLVTLSTEPREDRIGVCLNLVFVYFCIFILYFCIFIFIILYFHFVFLYFHLSTSCVSFLQRFTFVFSCLYFISTANDGDDDDVDADVFPIWLWY